MSAEVSVSLRAVHSVNRCCINSFSREWVRRLLAEEGLDVLFVHAGDQTEMVQIAFLLLGLLGEDVAVVSVFSLDLS